MRTSFLIAGALALSTSLAAAQDAPQETVLTDQHLDAVDGDDDGAVSVDEFRAAMRRIFEALDRDANGVMTWAEAEGSIIRDHFDAFDADRNGNVTAAEMDARAQADHAASDLDGDGALN
jgi:Ca2+-binding EF-hand superfamily protein